MWPEGDKRTTPHDTLCTEPADSTHSSTRESWKHSFLLSFKRNPEPLCSTIKPLWQIYSVGISHVFMSTDETAYFIWTVKSTPANEYSSACLTVSNGILHLGYIWAQRLLLLPESNREALPHFLLWIFMHFLESWGGGNKSYKLQTLCAYNYI